jgi:hypothetical protein
MHCLFCAAKSRFGENLMVKRLMAALVNWIHEADARAFERYLAQSANGADLERRIREWEARHNRSFNGLP